MFELILAYAIITLANSFPMTFHRLRTISWQDAFTSGFFMAIGSLYALWLIGESLATGLPFNKLSDSYYWFAHLLNGAVSGWLLFSVLLGSTYIRPFQMLGKKGNEISFVLKYSTDNVFLCGLTHLLHLSFLLSILLSI